MTILLLGSLKTEAISENKVELASQMYLNIKNEALCFLIFLFLDICLPCLQELSCIIKKVPCHVLKSL